MRRHSQKHTRRKASLPVNLVLPGSSLNFLFQEDDFRTLRLRVYPDGSVRVRAPLGTPLSSVFSFVEAKLNWIRKNLEFFAAHRPEQKALTDGGTIWFLGRPFTVRSVPARQKDGFLGKELFLRCRNNDPDLNKAFRRWQQTTAKSVLARRLARLEAKVRETLKDNAPIPTLTVRSLKRRWGSCSVKGNIVLAAQLVSLPLPLMDYVIIHELCHLRHMDHSPAFHTLLLRLLPDAKPRKAALHVWGLEHPRC